jgi:hypothetical protein
VVSGATRRKAAIRTGVVAVIALCAGAFAFEALSRADSKPAAAVPSALPASALSYLPSHATVVSSDLLAKDASLGSLPSTLDHLGFVTGRQRVFQGPSKRELQYVESRTLHFSTPAGAAGYVAYVRQHAGAYVGQIPTVKPLVSRGRSGVLIIAPLCACHMAQPNLYGIVSSGRRVTWLEINGPGATRTALAALLAHAP